MTLRKSRNGGLWTEGGWDHASQGAQEHLPCLCCGQSPQSFRPDLPLLVTH